MMPADTHCEENNCPAKRSRFETNSYDATALFSRGRDRLRDAQAELALAERNMEDIRQRIRAGGGVEPDSLLYLCDGEDNDVLSYIMDYLAFEDVGRCEIVCNSLKNQSKHIWGKFDERYLKDHPTRQSPSARDSREKIIQYHLASTLARRIGTLGDSIAKHLIFSHYDRFSGTITITEGRVLDCCRGCDFPDLDFAPLDRDTANDYEIYLRFSRTDDNKLFAEGFAPPPEREDNYSIKIELQQMDFSGWPDLLEINRHVVLDGDAYVKDHHNFLIRCMKELTVIVVAVHKVRCKASLVIAQSNFGDGRSEDGAGIDCMQGHGFC